MISRATFLTGSTAALIAAAPTPTPGLRDIEIRYGGRLGVSAIDLSTGATIGCRENERFALCSTFKFFLVAGILSRIDAGELKKSSWIHYTRDDLVEHSPVTEAHVKYGGMALIGLCAAAVQQSDNTAANLLLRQIGGSAGATRYVRSLGDNFTRLDRNEPSLNVVKPGDAHDTTTPLAMRKLMTRVLTESALSPPSVDLLESWMIASRTALTRLRAGFPKAWKAGDKSGSGDYGATNDIAFALPPRRTKPILVAAYYSAPNASDSAREAALRDVGRAISVAFTSRD